MSYRAAKLALLEYPITYYLTIYNHENGHRHRALEIGYTDVKIDIALPPPIEFNPSFTSSKYKDRSSPQQRLMRIAGGTEANSILSNLLRKNMMLDDEVNYHNAFFYLASANDLNFYVLGGLEHENSDITKYIDGINWHYTKHQSTQAIEKLKAYRLQVYSVISLLTNPLNYNAMLSVLNYVLTGKTNSKLFTIPVLQNIQYYPSFRFCLSPYGPEMILQNYMKYKRQLYSVDISLSDGTFERSWRVSINMWNWQLHDHWSINTNLQLWDQPEIEYYRKKEFKTSKGFGGDFIITANYDFISNYRKLGASIQIGYKSSGFMEGEMLDKGLILRGGLTFKLKK